MIDTDIAKVFDAQIAFMRRLGKYQRRVCFSGAMDAAQRWEVIRREILDAGLADELAGKTETFRQAFERISGTKLDAPTEQAA